MLKILFICPTTPSSGNKSTGSRIQAHLSSSLVCKLHDPTEIVEDDSGCFRKQLLNFITMHGFNCALLLHAFKSGRILMCSCDEEDSSIRCPSLKSVPYGVIFGGTDLNVDIHDPEKLEVISKVLEYSRFSVSFNQPMKDVALKINPKLNVFVQPQAIDMPDMNSNYQISSIDSFQNCNVPNVCLMVTGIRPVKDPIFLLEEVAKRSSMQTEVDFRLLIMGPILDQAYARIFFEKLRTSHEMYGNGSSPPDQNDSVENRLKSIDKWASLGSKSPIFYSPPVSSQELITLLHRPYIMTLVNSSISEGMSSAILEALSNGVPVVARSNPGNQSLITDGVTGLLFDTPEQFLKQAERLTCSQRLRETITENGYSLVQEKHSPDQEKQFYNESCAKYFTK